VRDEPAEIAAVGSLEAKIIRACTVHKTCPLTCKQRRVEELGEIARFSTEPPRSRPWILEPLKTFFGR